MYMDGMTIVTDPAILYWIFKGNVTKIAYAKLNGFLNVGHF